MSKSWEDVINKQIDEAIDNLKAAKINPDGSIKCLKEARRCIKRAIVLEEVM